MTTRKTTASKKTTTPRTRPSTTTRAKTTSPSAAAKVSADTPETAVATAVLEAATAPPKKPALKKKDLFERVKARASGVKGQDVRVVMDAVLEELGALLVDGDSLNAQPLGMLKVQKHRPISGADVVVCKLRRKKPEGPGKDPLAEAAE